MRQRQIKHTFSAPIGLFVVQVYNLIQIFSQYLIQILKRKKGKKSIIFNFYTIQF